MAPFNPSSNQGRNINYNISKKELYNETNKNNLKILETESGYHYELKIPGYIKEDFRFYISRNQLVITTEKIKTFIKSLGNKVSKNKHSYCYPSAYFKMKIPLPKKLIKKEIFVNYKNEVLSFDLLKQ
ncbi:Hsp20/alpha crystallin family protein [Seonamhaeicola sp. MEBiC1930]|uniref:Hsp20/alpha crystallin family protein n=1 Tax=Seonamhaeicola sp. MEBiC01930 TaxID=2976768 RepID=UPI00324C06D2